MRFSKIRRLAACHPYVSFNLICVSFAALAQCIYIYIKTKQKTKNNYR